MNEARRFGWHDGKAESNLAGHKVPFEAVYGFDFDTAMIAEDTRKDYGEIRMVALGFIADRLHVLVYTQRLDLTWVISLRKANDREVRSYDDFAQAQE